MDPARIERLREAVSALYERNRQRGFATWCGRPYDFVCPSHVTYPFQWFWDSCFHAVVLSHLDPDRAEAELTSLLANQQKDGFIPHVTFWQRDRFEEVVSHYAIAFRTRWLSDQMQPPALAEAVRAVADRGRGEPFLREVLPAVRRFYDWCRDVRDPDRDGLIAVLQPDETGLDHSPKFDELLGVITEELDDFTAGWHRVADPYQEAGRDHARMFAMDHFVVEEVMVNTLYAENQRVLGDLLEGLGDAGGAAELHARSQDTERALLEKCWDEERGIFFDLSGPGEAHLETNTVTSLFPLLLPGLDGERVERLVGHLRDPEEYAAPYPVPSVAMNQPGFRPGVVGEKLVWRGPTWMNANWYLVRGLRRHGFDGLADHIAGRSLELVERSGFREYYHPLTGEGLGAPDFSWTALVLDMVEDGLG